MNEPHPPATFNLNIFVAKQSWSQSKSYIKSYILESNQQDFSLYNRHLLLIYPSHLYMIQRKSSLLTMK
jgi:hypothetical protein